ncbi:hypothetical protein ABEB36_006160 [Hypothenemus hampei]|uniref:Uncharacterized protein n=1 Tax=Hypothenemus hampei TaxID=57062 RepID=A0ABD1F141_HYPHA
MKEQYKNKVDFIKHSQVEQKDDSSCGPMTINNLEIMALKVKEANDEGKDGISELIRLFKGESGGIAFTTQDQVQSIRISHSLQNKSPSNTKQDINVDDLRTIMTKLDLGNNYISMEDDQLRRLEIKNNEANNQPEEYYTHENLRVLTINYISRNKGQEFSKNIEERLQTQNTDSLHVKTYNTLQNANFTTKKIVNLQYTGTHYNSLIAVDIEHITSKKEDIESYIHKIDEHYDKLKDWKINELKNWSRKHKGYLSKDFSDTTESADNICRAVAVMDRD